MSIVVLVVSAFIQCCISYESEDRKKKKTRNDTLNDKLCNDADLSLISRTIGLAQVQVLICTIVFLKCHGNIKQLQKITNLPRRIPKRKITVEH